MMTEDRTIQLAEIPIGGTGGAIWNRLHGEREDVCEALLKRSDPAAQAPEQEELLQARLRMIDDALDRLMSNKTCTTTKLGESGSRGEVMLENLNSFDTILIRTHNSDYRILLLEPTTGRALIEGGSYLLEPSEGLVKGSALLGSAFQPGALCVGGRVEMWVKDQVFLTSPIESVELKHNAAAESLESVSAVQ